MMNITVMMMTKNEEAAIALSLPPLMENFKEVIIVDSNSKDKTASLATDLGAKVVNFTWDGTYPKKRQWSLDNIETAYDIIFMIDADEVVTPAFIKELKNMTWSKDGYFVRSKLIWDGKKQKFGMMNNKLCLFKKQSFEFPKIDDLNIIGMGEIEGHYQPVIAKDGTSIGQIKAAIDHNVSAKEWAQKHNRYGTWEIAMNEKNAWPVDPVFHRELIKDFIRTNPFRPYLMFTYGYILKGGFLDGKMGLDIALKRFAYHKRIINARDDQHEHGL
jgi:glycosyltransferase involved in cell wall biosynthesis